MNARLIIIRNGTYALAMLAVILSTFVVGLLFIGLLLLFIALVIELIRLEVESGGLLQ